MKQTNRKILIIFLWLLIWQGASIWIDEKILLVSPISVLFRLFELMQTISFWSSIASSLIRIMFGFGIGFLFAILFAILSYRFFIIKEFLYPFVLTLKSVPVASFIILILIWVSSDMLSTVIAFFMVFPILYESTLIGLQECDEQLLEMADVFDVPFKRRLRYIYVIEVLPYIQSGCSLALALAWKAGVAAEVIGLPNNSIGQQLYDAKIYLATDALFAWTIVILCISIIFERLFLYVLNTLAKHIYQEER
ncbi:MAG: ABC transporter permease [Breznakia sp.]